MNRLRNWKIAGALCAFAAISASSSFGQDFKTLTNFDGRDGMNSLYMSLVQGTDGGLRGTTGAGGTGDFCGGSCGTVFKVTRSGKLTNLYSFCSQESCADGQQPEAGLVLATNGNFYGTTFVGGFANTCNAGGSYEGCGTVFEITPTGELTTLYKFCEHGYPRCSDGLGPIGSLVQGFDGDFYGTTFAGGVNTAGTVFKITLAGELTTLHEFGALVDDGLFPYGGLVQARDGNFYGTTFGGGSNGLGSVFKMTPTGKVTILHSFNSAEGMYPEAGLVLGENGSFYGTTNTGGLYGEGAVFKISADGKLGTLHSFCAQINCPDGKNPTAPLVIASDGSLYGTTEFGGRAKYGVVFRINRGGVLTTLHSFENSDGAFPVGLTQGTDGKIYGTTNGGGDYLDGTIFSIDMGLGSFITFVRNYGKIGQSGGILGQGFTGTTSVTVNGIPASFKVISDTYLVATVPPGATTGYVTVTTPTGTLTSNKKFVVLP